MCDVTNARCYNPVGGEMYNDSDSDGGNWDDSDDDDFYRRKASAVVEEERTPDVVTFTHVRLYTSLGVLQRWCVCRRGGTNRSQ